MIIHDSSIYSSNQLIVSGIGINIAMSSIVCLILLQYEHCNRYSLYCWPDNMIYCCCGMNYTYWDPYILETGDVKYGVLLVSSWISSKFHS